MKLTDSTIRTLKPKKTAQKLSDGGGLFLHVLPNGSKHWRMAYRYGGRQKLLSFGPYPLVSLREARDKRDEAKKLLLDDIDPLALKQEAKAAKEAAEKDERENFAFVAWIVPESRMKMRREHVVPLADQVAALLKELQKYSGEGKYLFPSIRAKSAVISDAAPLAALRKLGYDQDRVTLHGFRAMASTNLNELGFRVDVIETQFAHKEPDSVRLAYNRAQYMEERRKMMQDWADWLDAIRLKI